MTLQQALSHYGSRLALSHALQVWPETISRWQSKGSGIPYDKQCRLEVLTKGALKADRK